MRSKDNRTMESGFSLLEIIVALTLFTIAIVMVTSMYSLSNRTYITASAEAEMAQNGRVALNRMNREIRQSRQIVTNLSSDRSNSSQEIMFENGHDTDKITYIRYYLDGEKLKRSEIAYYFPSEEDVYVKYNTKNEDGDLPDKKTFSDNLVAEHVADVDFWGSEKLVNIYLHFVLNGNEFEVGTSVYSRNN